MQLHTFQSWKSLAWRHKRHESLSLLLSLCLLSHEAKRNVESMLQEQSRLLRAV